MRLIEQTLHTVTVCCQLGPTMADGTVQGRTDTEQVISIEVQVSASYFELVVRRLSGEERVFHRAHRQAKVARDGT